MTIIRTTLIVSVSILAGVPALLAEPSHKDPNAYWSAHGDNDEVKALYAATTKLSATVIKEMQEQLKASAERRLGRFSGKKIAATHAKLMQYQRQTDQLMVYGEPAGVELRMRSALFASAYNAQVIKAFPGLPTSARFMTQLRAAMKKQAPAREKAAAKLQELAVQEQWQEAVDSLYKIEDSLNAAGIEFLTEAQRTAVRQPFFEVSAVINTAAQRLLSGRATRLLAESRARQLPNFDQILAEIKQAIANIGTTGKTPWQDETVDGPQLVEKVGAVWKEAHVATLRCQALDWANLARKQYGNYGPSAGMAGESTDDPLLSGYLRFTRGMLAAFQELLTVEAGRVDAEQVVELHSRYLAALSPVLAQVADRNSLAPIGQALHALAAKLPDFGAEVDAYDEGTTELLRWRARAAAAIAKSREGEFAELPSRVFEATKSVDDYRGLFTIQRPETERPRLLTCAPKLLPPAIEKLVGQKARAGSARRVTPTSRSSIAVFDRRTYANLPAELPLAAEVEQLKFDLMVSDEAPALTLVSTMAVDSAMRGDLASTGGEIIGAHLESLITRFATLPNAASILVPFGQLPNEKRENLLPQAVMRFDLRPTWAQHEYFFVELSPATTE